mmetsp:Transcript_33596/g.51707  ORF Transcript_33596/g.51707 Transcript_33596/m.51707 type:complete len:132 (+) Transcript_33596:1029-1424(+)
MQQQLSNTEESLAYTDFLFEKDISEAMGFTSGDKPHEDIKGAGMFGTLTILNFLEKINGFYSECLDDNSLMNSSVEAGAIDNNVFMANLLKMSQSSSKKRDGFPLILVLFQVVENCLNLIETKPNNARNQY